MSTHAYETPEQRRLAECDPDTTASPDAVARATDALPARHDRDALVDIFAALADPTRASIVLALASGPLCVCDIADVAGVTQSAASHQLRVLRLLDLVAFERQGKRAVYRLADDHVRQLLDVGLSHARESRR